MSPKQEAARDYFLHVLDAEDAAASTPAVASATEEADVVKLSIEHAGAHYELAFAKTGDLGGHLTKTMGGATVCDQALGQFASGTGGAGGGGAGGGPSGGAGGDGGAGGAGGGTGDDGGCGCRAAGAEGELASAIAVLGALGLCAGRRRRRRSL